MFRKRYLSVAIVIFSLGVIFGISIDGFDTSYSRAVFVVMLTVSALVVAVLPRHDGKTISKRMSAAAVAVAAFSLGVLRVSLYDDSVDSSLAFDKKSDVAVFEVAEVNDGYFEAYVKESEIGVPKFTKVRIFSDNEVEGLLIGDTVNAEVRYSYKNSSAYYAKGISLSASGTLTEHNEGSGFFYAIRKSISENSLSLYENFEYSSSISKAVMIGDRSDLNSYIFSVYKTAGISHILAISGLHISIITLSLHRLLEMLRVNKNLSCLISAFTAVFYAALVGFTAGVVRSAVMISVYMVLRLLLKNSDSFTSLFIALFILIAINPYAICSAGLQLSFLCSLGIMISNPLFENVTIFFSSKRMHSKGMRHIIYTTVPLVITPALTSTIASIFSFPVLCISFDTVSYISPVVNIIAVPLFTYGIYFSIIAFMLAPFAEAIAVLFATPAGFLFDLVTELSVLLYDLDIGVVSAHADFMFIPLIISILIILTLLFLNTNQLKIMSVLSAVFCVSLVFCTVYNSYSSKNQAVIEYGNTNGKYLYFAVESKGIYVDLGGYRSDPNVVFENGFTSLDSYVITGYNSYSCESFDYLSGNLKVSKVYLPEPKDSEDMKFNNEIKELAKQRNCDIMYFDDYVHIECIYDSELEIYGNNDYFNAESLVCINAGELKFRFVGNDFDNAVNCDVAILEAGYGGDLSKIISDVIYAEADNSSDDEIYDNEVCKSFDNRIRVKFDYLESGFKIYEP